MGARIAAINLFQVDLEKPQIYLWFAYENAPPPLLPPCQKGRGQYPRHFTTLRCPWNYLWCCYVRALVPRCPPFPVMHARSDAPGCGFLQTAQEATESLIPNGNHSRSSFAA